MCTCEVFVNYFIFFIFFVICESNGEGVFMSCLELSFQENQVVMITL
jgi:hypothetical protein